MSKYIFVGYGSMEIRFIMNGPNKDTLCMMANYVIRHMFMGRVAITLTQVSGADFIYSAYLEMPGHELTLEGKIVATTRDEAEVILKRMGSKLFRRNGVSACIRNGMSWFDI